MDNNDCSETISKKHWSNNKMFLNIMNKDTYTQDIKDYLELENKYLLDICDQNNYTTIIEVGCAKGIKAELFYGRNIKYIGIDINPDYIKEAIFFASEKALDYASFSCISFNEISSLNIQKRNNVLVYLPFNLYGNLEKPMEIFEIIKEYSLNLLIFTYQDNELANAERLKYYQNCGFVVKHCENQKYSSFYSDDGFNSKVYKTSELQNHFKLLIENDYFIKQFNVGSIGVAYSFNLKT